MKRLARVTLASGIGAAALAAPGDAAAQELFNPGLALVVHESPERGNVFGLGFEATYNVFDDLPAHGAFFQLEMFFDGSTRVGLGYQLIGPGLGAEMGLSVGFADGRVIPAAQLAPWFGLGYVNGAARLLLGSDGLTAGGSLTVKAVLDTDDFELYTPAIASGRPLRDAAGTPTRPTVAIVGRRRVPLAAARLPRATRLALGRAWLDAARDEHAAIGAFGQLAADLEAHDAPPGLSERARAAAVEEDRHARGCFAIAGALLGLRLRPVDRPLPSRPTPDRAALAVTSLLDGEVNEGLAAALARAGAERARPAPVKRVLDAITREEAGHATLARDVRRWAEQGHRAARRAVQTARDARPPTCVLAHRPPPGAADAWAAWGQPLPEDAPRAVAALAG